MNKKVFIDFETTGFGKNHPVSIALIAFENDKRIASKYVIINPESTIEAGAFKIHGISQEVAKTGPNFKELWKDIHQYFEDAIIISHNISYDVDKCLIPSLKRYDLPIPNFMTLCTLENAKIWIPKKEVQNYKLGTLCEHFNITLDNAHDARDDALGCMRLYNKLAQISEGDMVIISPRVY